MIELIPYENNLGYSNIWRGAGMIFAESEEEAVLALAYFRLNFPRVFPVHSEIQQLGPAIRQLKVSTLKLGDYCLSNIGDVTPDLKLVKGSDERELYFLVGNTAIFVVNYQDKESMLPIARKLEKMVRDRMKDAAAQSKQEEK